MIRLHRENLNTPEYFDHIWHLPGIHKYDATRLREFMRHSKLGDRVLDVGAGVFGFAQYVMEKMHLDRDLVAVDFSLEAGRLTHQHTPALPYVQADTSALPFPNNCFDTVGCGELIEHMEDPRSLVKELFRVCRLGGWVVISTVDTLCDAARLHGDYPEHLWEFTPRELRELFLGQGNPVEYNLFGHYHMIHARKATSDGTTDHN